jgi:hypothetical protein
VDGHAAVLDLDVLRERELGQAEQLGQHRRHHARRAVVGLGRADDQVRRLGADGRGQRAGGQERVRAGERGVRDQDAAVGAHGEALADGVACLLGAHGDEDDLAAVRLLELEADLDPALVAGIEHDLAVPGDGVVRIEALRGVRIGHLLHGHDNLQIRALTVLGVLI